MINDGLAIASLPIHCRRQGTIGYSSKRGGKGRKKWGTHKPEEARSADKQQSGSDGMGTMRRIVHPHFLEIHENNNRSSSKQLS